MERRRSHFDDGFCTYVTWYHVTSLVVSYYLFSCVCVPLLSFRMMMIWVWPRLGVVDPPTLLLPTSSITSPPMNR